MIDPIVESTLVMMAAIVLLPIVPAVLIYKLLPNQRVSTTGRFAGMQLKATGAVGFYTFVLVVAVAVQRFALGKDGSDEFETWTVNGTVRLADSTDSIPRGAMTFELLPPSYSDLPAGAGAKFRFLAPVMKNQSEGTIVQVNVPRYVPVPLSLNQDSDPAQPYRVKRDRVHRILTIDDIVLSRPASQYAGGTAITATPPPAKP